MNLILCVEKNGGMAFNLRRVSQDKVVIQKIAQITEEKELYAKAYSASLFSEIREIKVIQDFSALNSGDFCFLEIDPIPNCEIEKIFLFSWNRNYPADLFFDWNLKDYKKIKKEHFEGNSHKKITLEVYEKVAK